LTSFTEEHFDRYAAMLADPACTRWIGDGHALNRMNAWRSMAMLLGHWKLRGFGMWALVNREDRAFLGRVGLMRPEGWPDIELGWMLCPDQRHRGYATEASEAVLHFAWERLLQPRVISLIRHDNDTARRVAERLGGRCITEKRFLGAPAQVYAYYPPVH
jgi:RimJ/RimL family protein N-acetyltransferase